jgi:hypothetical protein
MIIGKFVKTSREIARVSIDYSSWMDPEEFVNLSVYDVTGIDVLINPVTRLQIPDVPAVITNQTTSPDGTTAIFYVSGGTIGQTYRIRALMTTTAGQVKDDNVQIAVTQF